LDGGTDEDEKRKEEEERSRREKEREEVEARIRKEKEEVEATVAKREATRKKASAVDPVARALLSSRARIEDAKRKALSASSGGGADIDVDTNGDANDVDDKEGVADTGRRGVSNLPAWMTKDNSSNNTTTGRDVSTTTSSHNGILPPPPLNHVTLIAPANLTPLAVEIIKLTAQHVALSEPKVGTQQSRSGGGDNFLTNLTLTQWTNPEFAFLQPRHAHFAYFTALVDEYKSFVPGGEEYQKAKDKARVDAKRERLAHMIVDESTSSNDAAASVEKRDTIRTCLEAAAYRAEYEREMVERRREASTEGGDNGILGGAGTIDWHDFVVVETIEFASDEIVEALPPPTSLRMAVLTKEQPVLAMAEEEQDEAKQETEEDSSSDSDLDMDDDGNDDDDDDDEGGEKLKVVSNYQPRVVSTKEITGDASRTHIIDPISGKSIPIADMPEHMRIQLLDPKWAEERKRFLEKQRETNFVAGEDIASNISRFAKARGDMFGSSDTNDDSERRLMESREQHTVVQSGPQPQPMLHVGMPPPPPPPPPMGMMPPIFAPPPPPPPSVMMAQPQPTTFSLDEEPAAKRIKVDELAPPSSLPPPAMMMILGSEIQPPPPPPTEVIELLSESDFIATLSDPNDVPICIRIPHDPSNSAWNFNGQIQDISAKATTTVKDLKALLKEQLGGMPMNKMQLKHPTSGFMNKDGLSLASLNIGPMTTIDLVPKTRGGRK
jgi:splicing factor 3A subunit 1